MSAIDTYLGNNAKYAAGFSKGKLPIPPAREIAIVACMDARLEMGALLGLEEGEAHVIRNAGGVVTDDVIRSLAISQRLLGTREIMLIHHTDCGMLLGFKGPSIDRSHPGWTRSLPSRFEAPLSGCSIQDPPRGASRLLESGPASIAPASMCT